MLLTNIMKNMIISSHDSNRKTNRILKLKIDYMVSLTIAKNKQLKTENLRFHLEFSFKSQVER